ncbi:MAG: SCP2 sterol-binding domain-containing protein [Nitrococcus sp.]|nr:SCP2 sterol-binding domain-containing protein [Nitrococcus sp.]
MALTPLAQPAREILLRAAETLLNRLLAADPGSPRRLRELAGCRLSVELTDIELHFFVLFSETGLRLILPTSAADTAPTVRLRSSRAGLLALATPAGRRRPKIEFSGEVGVVQDLRRLFTELEVDWEEQIARYTGDVLAHQLGRAVKGSTNWLRRSGESALQTIGEYLTEERRDLPAAAEVSGFVAEVDCLHQEVERLAARVRRLEQGLDGGTGR